MENVNNSLIQASMRYGFPLGMFWVFKYLFYMGSLKYPFLVTIYWGMSFVVPYLAYLLTKKYRNDLGGNISFFRAWQFGIFIYFFAALIVAVMHYMFYRFVAPPDFVKSAINQTLESLAQLQADSKVIQSVKSLDFSPIHMALQGILNNVFYGIIFSIPVAALLCRNNQTGSVK